MVSVVSAGLARPPAYERRHSYTRGEDGRANPLWGAPRIHRELGKLWLASFNSLNGTDPRNLAPQAGFGTAGAERSEATRFPRDNVRRPTEAKRGSGSSGWIRTNNPPVNRLMRVVYPVGSPSVYLTLGPRFSLVFGRKLFTDCSRRESVGVVTCLTGRQARAFPRR
jgi:hypothetical protein